MINTAIPCPNAAVTFTVAAGEGRAQRPFHGGARHHRCQRPGGADPYPGSLPGPNTVVKVSLGIGHELASFTADGVGVPVVDMEGDYRTWQLPTAASVRLGKGAMGEGDRAVALSADGRCLAVASAIGVWLYEASTSRAMALLSDGESGPFGGVLT